MFRLINKLKNRKGFTLIELIVVLAVLAVIMAIAVPRFLGVQERAEQDADEATLEMVAKAAELYYIQENLTGAATGVDIQDLITADYIDGFEMQSTSYSSITTSDDIDYDTDGFVEKVGSYTVN